MSTTRSKSQTKTRAPPKPRPDPTGMNADAESVIGKLRKILFIIIYTVSSSRYTEFCETNGLSNYKDFIKTQATWYHVHQSWDPKQQPKEGFIIRFSKVRNKIAEVYNAMSFPRHFQDLVRKLVKAGCNIRRWRILKYLRQLAVFPSKISRCLNPTKQSTCIDRVEGAKKMVHELDELCRAHESNPLDKSKNWYYYDQSPFQQIGPKRDVVLGPRKLKIYDPKRITLKYTSLTLHMIVDQKGEIFDFLWAKGGQGMDEIRSFLTKAASRLPTGIKGIVYCDHLKSHQTLSVEKTFVWDVRLVPKSSSDANIIENVFSSLKNHLYKSLKGQKNVLSDESLIKFCTSGTQDWWQGWHGDLKLLQRSRAFLNRLIKAEGDLQQVEFLKRGIKNLDQLKVQVIPEDSTEMHDM